MNASFIAELAAKNINVCVNSVEHNMYDDSDFCDIMVNFATRQISEFCTHTTRAGGYKASPSVALTSFTEAEQTAIMDEFKRVARSQVRQYYIDNNIKHTGDTLIVSNPKARKHKGEVFICTGFSEYTNMYGRVATRYAHGDTVKTNVNNCNVIDVSENVLNEVWDNLFYGVKL